MTGALDTARDRLWLGRPLRVVAVVLATLVALPLLLQALDRATTGTPPDPLESTQSGGSSYDLSERGTAGAAELLARNGVAVRRLRGVLRASALDPGRALFVIEPGPLEAPDARALTRFVDAGGRLVIGGRGADRLVAGVVAVPPVWRPSGPTRYTARPDLRPITTIRSIGAGTLRLSSPAGGARPLVAAGADVLIAEMRRGSGRVVVLADASVLSNRLLATADNAALVVALADGRPVTFAEAVHGFGRATGLAALPARWKVALTLLAGAALLLVWARGRRLGDAERSHREPAPARVQHVDALGALLDRTCDPDGALDDLRAATVRAVIRRAHADPGSGETELREVAARCGLSPDEVEALVAPLDSPRRVVAAGQAFARTQSWER